MQIKLTMKTMANIRVQSVLFHFETQFYHLLSPYVSTVTKGKT